MQPSNTRSHSQPRASASGAGEPSAILSPDMLHFAKMAADCGHPVLLYGETGSGKTLLAREIHDRSSRRGKPFVRVNCAAIPDSLFEREMFGHVRGAFTDAREGGTGFFEAADGGTLFLDEIGEIPLAVQPKLLAALEEGYHRKLGSPREIAVQVQIIAATNRDLREMVRTKQFREDLYYRFSVLRYLVPPLRDRRGELPALVQDIVRRTFRFGERPPEVSEQALQVLLAYPWPGNIRELENVLRATTIFACGATIEINHLPQEIRSWQFSPETDPGSGARSEGPARYAAPTDRGHEMELIRSALAAANGNKSCAARMLGMSRSTLWAKLKEYGTRM